MNIVKRALVRLVERHRDLRETINDLYMTSAPSPQNALNIFKGEWASRFPPSCGALRAGSIALFEDPRIDWFARQIGGVEGLEIIELGPLEAGHSAMLERLGARQVVAIEANTHAFLKCLIAKEVVGLERVRFLCGDFLAYLRDPACPEYDAALASGVLYHMVNPVELIARLAGRCRSHLLLWTHYYDRDWAEAKGVQGIFPVTVAAEYGGFRHTLVRQEYGASLGQSGFCGGSRFCSHWMLRDEILACLAHFGFPDVRIGFDEPDHPGGPSFAVVASRGEHRAA